jgi:hypothetical protein
VHFDNFVSLYAQRGWNDEAPRIRGLAIYDEPNNRFWQILLQKSKIRDQKFRES